MGIPDRVYFSMLRRRVSYRLEELLLEHRPGSVFCPYCGRSGLHESFAGPWGVSHEPDCYLFRDLYSLDHFRELVSLLRMEDDLFRAGQPGYSSELVIKATEFIEVNSGPEQEKESLFDRIPG